MFSGTATASNGTSLFNYLGETMTIEQPSGRPREPLSKVAISGWPSACVAAVRRRSSMSPANATVQAIVRQTLRPVIRCELHEAPILSDGLNAREASTRRPNPQLGCCPSSATTSDSRCAANTNCSRTRTPAVARYGNQIRARSRSAGMSCTNGGRRCSRRVGPATSPDGSAPDVTGGRWRRGNRVDRRAAAHAEYVTVPADHLARRPRQAPVRARSRGARHRVPRRH